jgi:hypothetical protein
MMSAQHAMEQAAMTAETYARKGARLFEDIFDVPPDENPAAAAVFLAAFMRTAAQDFDTAVMSGNTE